MNKAVKIEVNGVSYPIKFGYGAIRLLGGQWNMKGFQPVVNKVAGLIPEGEDIDLSFEMLDTIGDLIWAGIINAAKEGEAENVLREDVVDAFFNDLGGIKEIFELFMVSMPKAKDLEGGKPKAPIRQKRSKK